VKNFIKIFFIFLCFFIPLSANAFNTQVDSGLNIYEKQQNIINNFTISHNDFGIQPLKNENSIAASNSNNHELVPFNERKDSFSNSTIFKSNNQNKLLQQFFYINYSQSYTGSSHKISSYLKNEICTRAP